MLYQFRCYVCDHDQEESFPMAEYDDYVEEDGLLKDTACEKCKTNSLYRHITRAPGVLGGCKGYVSMERWQKMNPDNARRKEAEITKKLEIRKARKHAKLDKQKGGGKRDQRHEGYGKNNGEERLSSD